MLFLIGWLMLAGYLLSTGMEVLGHIVLWGGLVLVIALFAGAGKDKAGRGSREEEEDKEMEELMLYETLFGDEEDDE